MNSLSWNEKYKNYHGVLIPSTDPQELPDAIFFTSRLRLFLWMLLDLSIPEVWIKSLPRIDLDVTVPSPEPECPICRSTYLENLDEEDAYVPHPYEDDMINGGRKEMPLRLPCGHILGQECIICLVREAPASIGVLCPLCRAKHNHIPISWEVTSDTLDRCMLIAIETFVSLNEWWEFQDLEAVEEWVQDEEGLCRDVQDEDKRNAIKYAVKAWAEMGEQELCQQLAVRAYGEGAQCSLYENYARIGQVIELDGRSQN